MRKKIVLITAVAALGLSATSAFAFNNKNIYVGGQLLRTDMNYSGSSYLLSSNSVDDKLWGGRLYAGYSFTDMWSAELGYGYYGKPEFKHDPSGNKQDMLQQGIDLVGKVSVPLDYGFGVYAKGGAMWVHRDSIESRSGDFVSKTSDSKFVPVGGVGVNYNFNPSWSADLSWTGTPTVSDLPKMYMYGVGLTYKFNSNGDSPAFN